MHYNYFKRPIVELTNERIDYHALPITPEIRDRLDRCTKAVIHTLEPFHNEGITDAEMIYALNICIEALKEASGIAGLRLDKIPTDKDKTS